MNINELIEIDLPILNGETQHLKVLEEERSYDWSIIYYIYKDKVIVIEEFEGNMEHAKKNCKDLETAIFVASKWC